jgi:hypothetical protein
MTLRVAYSNYERFFDFLLVRPALLIDGEMNRCVNTKDGTLPSAPLYATMPLMPLGNAQQYCSVFNFQFVFRGLFLLFAEHCLGAQTDSVRQ